MFRFYPIVIAIQLFCLYHAFKNRAEQKWFWVILFFPFIGCLFYLYYHFYSRQNISRLSDGIKVVTNSNYHIVKLEKEVEHCDSVRNKTILAEQYLRVGRYNDASKMLESCISNFNSDDPDLLMPLIRANYLDGNYNRVIELGDQLEGDRAFIESEEKVAYAWAFFENGDVDKASSLFEEMDKKYTNYNQRVECAKFLAKSGKKDEAFAKLDELYVEYKEMESYQKKYYKGLVNSIRNAHNEIDQDKGDEMFQPGK